MSFGNFFKEDYNLAMSMDKRNENKKWIKIIGSELPPEGKKVNMRIDDQNGIRNEAPLIRKGYRFFLPDMSMYVYYTPTHWEKLP